MGRRRFGLRGVAGGLALLALLPPLLLLVGANGITASGLAFMSLMAAIGLAAFAKPETRRGRLFLLVGVGACVLGFASFIAQRLWADPPAQAFRFVEHGRRDVSPPWLSRIVDERETVLSGLRFSNLFGMIRGSEMEHLDELLRRAYSADFEPWPNAALINALPTLPRHLEHVPPGTTRRPCLVFLHGFGGQLTAYLHVLERALGDRYVIAAPFLDFTGAFWTPRGKAAVKALVSEHLPREVDRDRVFLIGLSNGALGATAILQDPELAGHFRGFILVSGAGEVVRRELDAEVLMIMGTEDPRFPITYNEGIAAALRERGARVETSLLEADHFIWLSHSREMTDTVHRWVSKR